MGQIKNIKLHIVTDIKPTMHGVKHFNRGVRNKVLNTCTYEYWKPLQVHKIQKNQVNIHKLYQGDGLMAVYKPYGVPTHAGAKTRFSVVDFFPKLEREGNLQNGSLDLANRLDQETSGVLLLTYTREMAAHIAEMQRKHRIMKEYLTVLVGHVQRRQGSLVGDVSERWDSDRYTQDVSEDSTSRRSAATTHYEILDNNGKDVMLCSFTTNFGAKHQIRVHAANLLNCPILGDHKYHTGPRGPQVLPLRLMQKLRMYGYKSSATSKGRIRPWQRGLVPLHLVAHSVVIPKLVNGRDLRIQADIPEFFWKTMYDCQLKLDRDEEEDEARRSAEKVKYTRDMNNVPDEQKRVIPSVPKGPSPYDIEKETSF